MIQHLLLMTIAPPLILLGSLCCAVVARSPRGQSAKAVIGPLFRRPPVQRLGRGARAPGVVLDWPPLRRSWDGMCPRCLHSACDRQRGMPCEQASFVGDRAFFSGGLSFSPGRRVTAWPRWSLVLYLFLATLPCDILSGFLVFSGTHRLPRLSFSAPHRSRLGALADQQMCGCADVDVRSRLSYLVAGTIVTTRLLSVPR